MPEEQTALEDTDGFEIKTDGESVSGTHLFADGGVVKEAVVRDSISGASSPAPANSGIPSALTQQSIHAGKDLREETASTEETPMADRTIPMHQDTQP